jgi:hypothetical protein
MWDDGGGTAGRRVWRAAPLNSVIKYTSLQYRNKQTRKHLTIPPVPVHGKPHRFPRRSVADGCSANLLPEGDTGTIHADSGRLVWRRLHLVEMYHVVLGAWRVSIPLLTPRIRKPHHKRYRKVSIIVPNISRPPIALSTLLLFSSTGKKSCFGKVNHVIFVVCSIRTAGVALAGVLSCGRLSRGDSFPPGEKTEACRPDLPHAPVSPDRGDQWNATPLLPALHPHAQCARVRGWQAHLQSPPDAPKPEVGDEQ